MKIELNEHPLFDGISLSDTEKLVACLHTYTKNFKKNEYILQEGNSINFVGVFINGRVYMEKEDYSGNVYFYTEISKDNLFGETFICPTLLTSTVNYRAITDCTIMFIRYDNLLNTCHKNCICHQLLIANLVHLLAMKSRSLLEKIEIISKKTIRERIISYLELLAQKKQSNKVISPLNHTELSSFLCVNRCSMIRELHKMKDEQLIDFDKNTYILLNTKNSLLYDDFSALSLLC